MALPPDLVFVRHGESEGNIANRAAREGNFEHYEAGLAERPGHDLRLTEKGIGQAQASGEWIRDNISEWFDAYYASYYLRTRETAAHLELRDAKWRLHPFLHERRLGQISGMGYYKDDQDIDISERDEDPLWWLPPNGESIMDVAHRSYTALGTLHREHDERGADKAIVVTHGDVLASMRLLLERMNELTFTQWMQSDEASDHIFNGQVLHYTRRIDPENRNSDLASAPTHLRSVYPWDMARSTNEWRQIERPTYTNEQMLEGVEYRPRIVP